MFDWFVHAALVSVIVVFALLYRRAARTIERQQLTLAIVQQSLDAQSRSASQNRTDLAAARKALKEPGRKNSDKMKAEFGAHVRVKH